MKRCELCQLVFNGHGRQGRCNSCRTHICQTCGCRFLSPNGRMDAKFCGLKCKGQDPDAIRRINEYRGVKPRTYHLHRRDRRGSAFDREWRAAVFARDNYTCQICGQRGGKLNAHHIKPFKAYPHLRLELSNGQTLCLSCHVKTDNYGWANYWRNEMAVKRIAPYAAQAHLPLGG